MRQQASKGNCPLFALHSFHDCWLVSGYRVKVINEQQQEGESRVLLTLPLDGG